MRTALPNLPGTSSDTLADPRLGPTDDAVGLHAGVEADAKGLA